MQVGKGLFYGPGGGNPSTTHVKINQLHPYKLRKNEQPARIFYLSTILFTKQVFFLITTTIGSLHGTHVEHISKPIQNPQTHQPTVKVRGLHIGLLSGAGVPNYSGSRRKVLTISQVLSSI